MRRPLLVCAVLFAACSPAIVPDAPVRVDPPDSPDPPDDEWERPEFDPFELPDGAPTVHIEIDAAAMARLDEDPFEAPDEVGVFTDDEGRRRAVDLSYRGAYALRNVINRFDLRNWKVKFAADEPYLGRREWNFNYEPFFRQKLAYDLFRFSGVAVPGAQHVILRVNGEYQGLYLQYEDPDDKRWLRDSFGDDEGDLYKAAFDLPGRPQCFADLTVLGSDDADYLCHYNKKTNRRLAPDDYHVLREFVAELSEVPDEDFASWLDANVDVVGLLSYLVVSNFIANWDSYPQRPKNFWLYEDLHAQRMAFIPWDLDGTFNPNIDATFNQMGTTASVWFDLLRRDYEPVHQDEGNERPLVRRMMGLPEHQAAYLSRYRELTASILSADYLEERLSALTAIVEDEVSETDGERLQNADARVREFIQGRAEAVDAELAGL